MEHDEIERKLSKISEGMQYVPERNLQDAPMQKFVAQKSRKRTYIKWILAISCFAIVAAIIPIGFLLKKDNPGYQNDVGDIVQEATDYSNLQDYNASCSTQFLGLDANTDRLQQVNLFRYNISQTIAWLEEITVVDTDENYSSTNLYAVVTKNTVERFVQMETHCTNQTVIEEIPINFSHVFNEEDYIFEGYAMWEYNGIKYYIYQFSLYETDFMSTLNEILAQN